MTHISPFYRLRGWMSAERTDIWVLVVYSVAIGLLSLVVPIATQSLVNTIAFGVLLQPLVVLSVLVLLGLAFAAVLKALRVHVVEVMQRRVFVRVCGDSMEHLLRARIDAYDGHGPELVNRFFDVVTLQKSGASLLTEGLEVIMAALIGMVLLAVYHPLLMVFSLLLLLSTLIVLFPLGVGAVRTAIDESKAKYAIAAWLQELARHPATFKTPAGAQLAVERGNSLVACYLDGRGAHWRVLLRQIAGSLALQSVGTAAVLAAGGWLVMERQLTLGQLVAAELVVAASLANISKFGKQLETFYDLLASVDKLGYITDLALEPSGPEETAGAGPAAIEIRQISFSFDPARPLLKDLSLNIPPGARLAIKGPTGSGKSTLIDLIYGFREPTSGSISLDGQAYRNLKLYHLRDQIALVRGVEIFHGSVEENIRLGNTAIDSGRVRFILDQVGLLEAIERLPGGLRFNLDTGGHPLTQNQAYRLMIARAIALQPRVLILDEILDRLDDGEDRDKLLEHLAGPAAPWTLILASQSPVMIGACQQTLTLELHA